ncbi:MAG TPA: transposase [Candidatus Limnocylindrales bacterium]
MTYHFRPVERDQVFLLPPSIRDWLPSDHLALFVLDAIEALPADDLAPFYRRYRADGTGAAAYDPAMMATLLVYAYATGERSSRRIETLCRESIAYRVITANRVPDHVTIARFRAQQETALNHLFGAVLALCARAGLGRLGMLALDGTKIAGATSLDATRTAATLDAEIAAMLAEAAAVDAAEDEEHGPERRGDELPAALAHRAARLERLREARRQLDQEEATRAAAEAERAARQADRAAAGRRTPGRKRTRERPPAEPRRSPGDPDSRTLRSQHGWVQGYNAQAVASEDGLIVAADLGADANDIGQLVPMAQRAAAGLAAAGLPMADRLLLADGGYWSEANVVAAEASTAFTLLIPPWQPRRHQDQRRPPPPGRAAMIARLANPDGEAAYKRRPVIIETIFAHLKAARGVRRFSRRGTRACHSEWLLACTTYNLRKLWTVTLRARAAAG